MRRVKKACVSSSAIPSWWSIQPSRVTLMLKVKSPMRLRSYSIGVRPPSDMSRRTRADLRWIFREEMSAFLPKVRRGSDDSQPCRGTTVGDFTVQGGAMRYRKTALLLGVLASGCEVGGDEVNEPYNLEAAAGYAGCFTDRGDRALP